MQERAAPRRRRAVRTRCRSPSRASRRPTSSRTGPRWCVEGRLSPEGRFHADNVLAKCPSKFEAAGRERSALPQAERSRAPAGAAAPRRSRVRSRLLRARSRAGRGRRRPRRRARRRLPPARRLDEVATRAVVIVLALTVVAMLVLFHAPRDRRHQLAYVAAHSARSMPLPLPARRALGRPGRARCCSGCSCSRSTRRRRVLVTRRAHAQADAVGLRVAARERDLLPGAPELPHRTPSSGSPPSDVLSDGTGLNPLLQHPVMIDPPADALHRLHRLRGALRVRLRRARDRPARHRLAPSHAALDARRRGSSSRSGSCSAGAGPTRCSAGAATGRGIRSRTPRSCPGSPATAYLHSVMIQEKRDMLRIWNLVLIGLTYSLCLFGTFLTRSGLVQSVARLRADGRSSASSSSATCSRRRPLLRPALLAAPASLRSPQRLESVRLARGELPVQQLGLHGDPRDRLLGDAVPGALGGWCAGSKIAVGPAVLQQAWRSSRRSCCSS